MDDGSVDFSHYTGGAADRLLWKRGTTDAATFQNTPGMAYGASSRGGFFSYDKSLPDAPDGSWSGIEPTLATLDPTAKAAIQWPDFDAEIAAQVTAWQAMLATREPPYSVSVTATSAAIVRHDTLRLLEDGAAFGTVEVSREFDRTRTYPSPNGPVTDTLTGSPTTIQKWFHCAADGVAAAVPGAPTLVETFESPATRDAWMYAAGGLGDSAFFLATEWKSVAGVETTTHTLRNAAGATVGDVGAQGFELPGGYATSRNGHLANRSKSGCRLFRLEGSAVTVENLSDAWRAAGVASGIEVNDAGDLLIQNSAATGGATADVLLRKFTDPASGKTIRAARQFSDDTLPAGWTDLRLSALGNTMPLADQQALEALGAYPPAAAASPAPMLAGTATKDGQEFPVLLIPVETVTDANRDGKIDGLDRGGVSQDNPFCFWTNDDDDDNPEPCLGDIPGTGADAADMAVNGSRDLLDFFPVRLQIGQLLKVCPPAEFTYRISHPTGAFRFLEMPDIHPDSNPEAQGAGSYLRNRTMADEAMARPMLDTAGEGSELGPDYLNAARDGAGVLLFEAKHATDSSFELVVSKKNGGGVVGRVGRALPVLIQDVESMYWRVNLRGCLKNLSISEF